MGIYTRVVVSAGILLGLSLCLTSCGFDQRHLAVTPFVLACDGEGDTYRPETGAGFDTGARIQEILRDVQNEFAARQRDKGDVRGRKRILIHIHGGLNSRSDSLEHAYRSLKRIRDEPRGSADYCVPIFVTWESGLLESYFEHLFKIRNGRHQRSWAVVSSPVWLASDLASGIVDTPRSLLTRLVNDVAIGLKVPFDSDVLPSWREAERNYERLKVSGNYRLGEYSRGSFVQGLRFLWYLVTFVPSVAVTAVAVDGPGTGAWDAMRHRAANLTHKYGEFKAEGSGEDLEASGAVARLVRALRDDIAGRPDAENYEVVLVGHSMGTIVLNDTLNTLLHDEAEHPEKKPLNVSRIVYMAAACSTKEAVQAVVPYLEKHKSTEFHALTLHPLAEGDESNAWDLAPRGSLLVWLDNWYTTPASPPERRFGKWLNLLQTSSLFHTIEDRMTVKGFGTDGNCIPQKHGDFNRCPYWRQSFWQPSGPLKYPEGWFEDEEEPKGKRY